jgi:hypothetical protein
VKKPVLYLSVDIEADGPIPGQYNMLSFGIAGLLEGDREPSKYFTCNLQKMFPIGHPDTMKWWTKHIDAWEVTRQNPISPKQGMQKFAKWLTSLKRSYDLVLIGYPITYDFLFLYWYLVHFTGHSPFGFSGLDIKTFAWTQIKHRRFTFRETAKRNFPEEWLSELHHTHNALEDAQEQAIIFARILKGS